MTLVALTCLLAGCGEAQRPSAPASPKAVASRPNQRVSERELRARLPTVAGLESMTVFSHVAVTDPLEYLRGVEDGAPRAFAQTLRELGFKNAVVRRYYRGDYYRCRLCGQATSIEFDSPESAYDYTSVKYETHLKTCLGDACVQRGRLITFDCDATVRGFDAILEYAGARYRETRVVSVNGRFASEIYIDDRALKPHIAEVVAGARATQMFGGQACPASVTRMVTPSKDPCGCWTGSADQPTARLD